MTTVHIYYLLLVLDEPQIIARILKQPISLIQMNISNMLTPSTLSYPDAEEEPALYRSLRCDPILLVHYYGSFLKHVRSTQVEVPGH